jgi:hypothetical protein
MTNTISATGAFDIDAWDETAYDEADGARLARVRLTKTFHGDIEGRSTAELLMVATQEETSRAYVGIERITGSVNGLAGSFVLKHNAIGSRDGGQADWTVVPDTGTGELRGIRGEAEIVNEPGGAHTFRLQYRLGS